MKIAGKTFASLLLLGISVGRVKAVKCGTPLTTACLGDTDKRYDPHASNNLKDQAVVRSKLEGLFVGEGTGRRNPFEPFGHIPAAPDPSVFIGAAPFYEFVNRSYDEGGSRFYLEAYTVVLATAARNLGFATTTYEKDGTLIPLQATISDSPLDLNLNATFIPTGLRTYPVDANTVYVSATTTVGNMGGVISTVEVCLDVDCNRYDGSTNIYTVVNGTVVRVFATELSYRRVETAEEWFQAIYDRYNESNIPLDERFDPMADICASGLCPTEEQWCRTDPNCSESPYQEPPASVRGDVIAGFTIAGVVLLVAVLYLVHRYLLHLQAQRYRTVFAKRIADTIQVRGSMRALPPDALVEEFNRIDTGVKDGKLSKEEMWEFVSSGKAGEMDRKDFDALFAAIDLDGSGNIDFLEFCAFMGKCHDEYRAARVDRGSIVAHHVSEVSTAFQMTPDEE